MKKLFIVLAVASLGFVACNNEADSTKTEDTPTVAPVEVAPAAPADTTNSMDTTKTGADTTTAAH